MYGRSTIEVIYLLMGLMERYQDKKKYLHLFFIGLEKAYDNLYGGLWKRNVILIDTLKLK